MNECDTVTFCSLIILSYSHLCPGPEYVKWDVVCRDHSRWSAAHILSLSYFPAFVSWTGLDGLASDEEVEEER